MAEIIYHLTQYAAAPPQSNIVWLTAHDVVKFNEHLLLVGQTPSKESQFNTMVQVGGVRYCLLYHDGLAVARGAVEPLDNNVWEAADIRTAKAYRNRGFATEILRFLSQHIIEHGKIASCRTEEDNEAMRAIIEAIGYQQIDR